MDVIITVQNSQPVPDAIASATVRVFDGAVLETQAVTDADGQVSLVLAGGTYTIWCGKTGVSFDNPYSITVDDPVVTTNNFTLSVEELADPIASDSSFCRCWGYFIDGSGAPFEGVGAWIWPLVTETTREISQHLVVDVVRPGTPAVVSDTKGIVASQKLELETNSNGLGWLDLVRTGTYIGKIRGAHMRDPVEFSIPDTAGTNILNLMLPFVLSVSYDPVSPYSVAVGSTLSIDLEPTLSNGDTAEDNACDLLEVTSSSSSLATVEFSSANTVRVTGVAAGSPTITLSPKSGILSERYPATTFSFTVTVS